MPNRSPTSLATTVLFTAVCATVVRAQTLADIRQNIRDAARDARYSSFIATLADLAEDAELSGGQMKIDGSPDTELTTFALPWRNNFLTAANGNSLHVEATLGYAAADIELADLWNGALPGQETSARSFYQSFGIDAGIGPSFQLADGGLLQPLVHAGIAYVHNDTDYGGPGAGFTRPLTDGILFNWDGFYGSYGASLALRPLSTAFDDVETKPLLRYDIRRTEGLHTDDPAQGAGETIQWATLRVDLSGPTSWVVNEKPVTWEADIGYRYLFGDTGDVLGFDDFFEFGLGLGFDVTERLPMLSELHFGASVQYGEDVFGWSVGLTARF